MQGRAYLDLAREVVSGRDELHWRGATIHAYYALVLECREALRRWGVVIPRNQSIHAYIRQYLLRARDTDLNQIARHLEWLGQRRSSASYDLNPAPRFTDGRVAQDAITSATDALALLDAIDGDPARRAAALASLPP